MLNFIIFYILSLVGNVLISTAFLSYQGPFNQDFRKHLTEEWNNLLIRQNIPFTKSIDIVEYLTNTKLVGEWILQKLPNDEFSIENATIATKASRYPLFIDPQSQAKSWIKNKERPNNLQVTNFSHKYFEQHLSDCLSLGRPLLIEDINEELVPLIENVLDKNFFKIGSVLRVKLENTEVDVLDGFMLYISTKLSNPIFTPEIFARASIIDFTVTMKGLEEQLLARVMHIEKNELELERVRLLEDIQNNKNKMKEMENNLLYRLTIIEGSIVEDEDLIRVLVDTKSTAVEVGEKLRIASITNEKINLAREEYRSVATRGSILYFLIVEMSMVNIMYQTSLDQFLHLFDSSLLNSTANANITKRTANILQYMTFSIFIYIQRGLYEKHKFIFTLLLTLKIDLESQKISQNEFLTLIKGDTTLDFTTVRNKPFSWILDSSWLNIVHLSSSKHFQTICDDISKNEKNWKQWYDKDAPEDEILPDGYNNKLDTFRKLLLIRSWRPDRTLLQAKKYIIESLDEQYVEGHILDLEKMFDESNNVTPMICFLSIGSDPTEQIKKLAKMFLINLKSISLGQGQETPANQLVIDAFTNGGWILLENCHLSLDFCSDLLEMLISTDKIHEECRIWLTTEFHSKFPIGLLQV
jgi:dynein heavy chain, axonemal